MRHFCHPSSFITYFKSDSQSSTHIHTHTHTHTHTQRWMRAASEIYSQDNYMQPDATTNDLGLILFWIYTTVPTSVNSKQSCAESETGELENPSPSQHGLQLVDCCYGESSSSAASEKFCFPLQH